MTLETSASTVKEEEIEHRFRNFAVRQLSTRPDLHQQLEFPKSLWEQMRRHQLFGIAVDRKYGGQANPGKAAANGPFQRLSMAGNALAEGGGNLGVCLSWLVHELTSFRLMQNMGTESQKTDWLPRLARGEAIACLAISEPGVGGHPKHLSTTAEKTNGGFSLNGEKTYLTNGPMADLFMVVAVTGNMAGKKQFTAFLTPKTTPGLTLSPALELPFLRPCPHGGIVLKGCELKRDQLLGTPGRAYEEIVLPFREVEDTLMMGPLAGGLTALLRYLITQLKQQPGPPDESVVSDAARLHCAAQALTAMAGTAARILDTGRRDERLTALGLFFRNQTGEWLNGVRGLIEKTGITPDETLSRMARDLAALVRIAGNVAGIKLQKLGQKLFDGL